MSGRLSRYWLGTMLVLFALAARGGNLVANGGFETGSYSPQWTLAPGGPFDQVCMAGNPIGAATCIVHSGQYAMSFGLNGAQDSLSQTIATVPGQTYVLTFFLANDNPADQNTTTFAVLWGGTTIFSLPSPQPSFPYQQETFNVVATTSSTQLTFVAQQDPSQWFLDDVSLAAQVTLAVVKTDGSATYTPGGTATYTITVTDTDISDAEDVTVSDMLPAGVTLTANVTCVANGNTSCGTVTGSTGDTSFGATGAMVGAGMGNSLVFTVPVAFASGLTTNPLVNTATATDLATNATASGPDSNTLSPQVTLAVVKTDGSTTYTPGGTANYTVTVTHGGLSDATNVTVSDALPPGVTLAADATCVANGSANCGTVTGLAGDTSFGATGAQIAAGVGNSLVFTLPVAFAATMTTDPLVNTATATDLISAATGSGTDSNARSPQVSLAVSKTDGSLTYTPGGTATYTVTVTDSGLTDALNVSVADALPTGVTLTGNVGCTANGSATCGTVTGSTGQTSFSATGATIGAGGGSSLVFTAPVAFASSLTDNPLVNAATARDLATGATGSGFASNALNSLADLAITKSDGVTSVNAGGTTTYTIVVSNGGPSAANGAVFTDPAVANLNVTSVTCGSASGGAACPTPPNTTVALMQGAGIVLPTLPSGGSVTFSVGATVAASATGSISNTANVAAPAGLTDPNLANNSATDTNTVALVADLAITKNDGVTSVVPGGSTTYTIVVSNNGPSNVTGATVTDVLPAIITSGAYTAVGSGGASGFTASGSGNINDTVNLPVGSTITYTLHVNISLSATGNLVNTASVAPPAGVTDPNLANNSATDIDAVMPATIQADLAITKTDGVTSINAGGTTTYTIVVSNGGPSAANGAVFTDPAVANLHVTSVTCGSASGGAACPTPPNTTVALMQGAGIVLPTLPSGGSVTFSVGATVATSATGSISNTANVAAPAGVTDPNPANNSATDTNTVMAVANLALAKTDGSATYTPGGSATYSITLTNSGPSNANDVTVTDHLPSGVTLTANVTCIATGAATCGTINGVAGGTSFTATSASIAAGSGNSLTYSLPVLFAASLTAPQVTNTASASDPAAPVVATGSDTNALSQGGAAAPIPADDRRALALLACLILLITRWARATHPRGR